MTSFLPTSLSVKIRMHLQFSYKVLVRISFSFLGLKPFLMTGCNVARNIIKKPKLVPCGVATGLTLSATLKQKSSSVEGIEKAIHATSVTNFGLLVFLCSNNCDKEGTIGNFLMQILYLI